MKSKRQLIFLIVGLVLLAAGGFFLMRRAAPSASQSQAVSLSDWIYASGGNLNVMVTYPEEIQTGRKNLITVTYEADDSLESVLSNGVVFDLQLDMIKTVIQPQKRMLIPLESGRKTFSWEVEPFTAGVANASISLALGDSSVSGNYAITAQQVINFSMNISDSGSPAAMNLTIPGFICLGVGVASLLAAFLSKKKQPVKKRK